MRLQKLAVRRVAAAIFRHSAIRLLLTVLALGGLAPAAQALPAFARQTGQKCATCHAGGQFPELTPYGRQFKLTGYTVGERSSVPLAVMGVVSYAKVRDTSKSDDPGADFQKNGTALFATSSIFLAGKVTDHLGLFLQNTYDPYAAQRNNPDGSPGHFVGHSQMDNVDLRYADHPTVPQHNLILGLSLNNNPSVADPWNSAAAWMQYTPGASPTSHQFVDGAFPGFGAGGNLAGLTAYGFLDDSVYAEFGLYRTANHALSIMSAGIADADKTHLAGQNPYWRLAYSREWGAHNLMVGTSGMVAHIFDAGSDLADPANLGRIRNTGIDAQYQYLADPHTITAQMGWMRQRQEYSANTLAGGTSSYFLADGVTPVAAPNGSDTTSTLRLKLSYIWQARYGGSLSWFRLTGSTNTLNQTAGFDSNGAITSTDPANTGITSTRVTGNLSGNPGTRGLNYELFWTPVQNVRVGAQYTAYQRFNGAKDNYDGFGRNASDNNTLRFYVWAAY